MATNYTILGGEQWIVCDEDTNTDDIALSINPAGQIASRSTPLDIFKRGSSAYKTTLTPSSGSVYVHGVPEPSVDLTNTGDCISIRSDGTDIYII